MNDDSRVVSKWCSKLWRHFLMTLEVSIMLLESSIMLLESSIMLLESSIMLLETFIIQASLMMIIIYNHHIFNVQEPMLQNFLQL